MRRNSTRLALQLQQRAQAAQPTYIQPTCANCRAFASFRQPASGSTASQHNPTRTQPRYRSTKPAAAPTLQTPTRRTQHSAAPSSKDSANEPRIKTLYDYFPTSIPAGPPPAGPFAIDTTALRREFLQLQACAHPDRHPAEHKARAETLSSLINDAYNTLRDPLRRAQYVLSLQGVDVANDETAKVEDQDLLMQVLEAQEAIEEAQNEQDLEETQRINEERLTECLGALTAALDADSIDDAKREAVRLRYWYNIREGIVNWEPGKPVSLVH